MWILFSLLLFHCTLVNYGFPMPTSIPATPVVLCFYQGQMYQPGTNIAGGNNGKGWCWGVVCDSDGKVIPWDNFKCATSMPTTTGPPITTTEEYLETTTEPTSLTPTSVGCVYENKLYAPGENIYEGSEDNWCFGSYCDSDSMIIQWDNFNCFPSTTSLIDDTTTTEMITTTTDETTSVLDDATTTTSEETTFLSETTETTTTTEDLISTSSTPAERITTGDDTTSSIEDTTTAPEMTLIGCIFEWFTASSTTSEPSRTESTMVHPITTTTGETTIALDDTSTTSEETTFTSETTETTTEDSTTIWTVVCSLFWSTTTTAASSTTDEPSSTESPEQLSTVDPTTTKKAGCFYNGDFYPVGEIERGEDGSWIWGVFCNSEGEVIHWDDFERSTTPHPESTTMSETEPPSTSDLRNKKVTRRRVKVNVNKKSL